ncbi:hypothetical protein [Dyadobacter tibetensis]|uniref:hypothetical protein n=1 Tax=Dyadobacter tibetensis TaxID=1211851 RepID=UPI00047020F1|nr:hypothetical protein [Dyadobacter tibetensis]
MKDIFFWKFWSSSERRLTVSVLALIALALLFLIWKSLDPLGNTIAWNVLSEVSETPALVDLLQLRQWQYGVSIPTQLVAEQFVASVMEPDQQGIYLFITLAITGFSLILGALTTLPRFWYLASMMIIILLIASTRLEMLYAFGAANKTFFLITLVLYGGLSYYLHAFRTDAGIAMRVGAMLLASIVLASIVGLSSPLSFVAFTFVSYSMPLWIICSVLFMLMISTELIAAMVWVSTAGSKGGKGLLNFLLITLLYLLYLLLFYLKNTRQIDWNLTLIHPGYLLTAASLLGIWGFRLRAAATEGVLAFRSLGFWLYSGLMIITLAFVALAFDSANDPVLEALEDIAVQGQLAMGLVFLLYILLNFYGLFRQGLAVHKVLYKPMRFSLTKARLFGIVGLVILISMQRLLPFHQSIAGYFNGLGDLHSYTQEFPLAEQYYQKALQEEFQNHKSNYGLASLALKQGDRNASAYYFRQALLKNPSPQAYIGLSTVLIYENLFFDALYSLKEGVSRFPQSGELLNNLGMLYAKTNVADSAYYFLEKSLTTAKKEEVPASNLLYLLGKYGEAAMLDSLQATQKEYPYLSWQANWFALQNLRQRFTPHSFKASAIPSDSLLSAASFAYLINYAQNQARHDSMPIKIYPRLAFHNPVLAQDLSFAALYPQFYQGSKLQALETLRAWSAEEGEKQQLYKKVYGHWLLQLGLYAPALEQLSYVEGLEGSLGLAIVQALQGNEVVASMMLDNLNKENPQASLDPLRQTLLQQNLRIKSPADSLLKVAQKAPSALHFDHALRANPFDENAVTQAASWYRSKGQVSKAYQIVIDALRFNAYAPGIWEQYALLSLDQGLLAQAREAEEKVRQYAEPAVYQAFAARYQSERALIEKQRASFQ